MTPVSSDIARVGVFFYINLKDLWTWKSAYDSYVDSFNDFAQSSSVNI